MISNNPIASSPEVPGNEEVHADVPAGGGVAPGGGGEAPGDRGVHRKLRKQA